MRLRDCIAEKYPAEVGSLFVGGVSGCPTDYEEISHMGKLCGGSKCSDNFCNHCWNRELKEKEPERKNEIDVNNVIIAVATLCMKKEEREKTLNTFKVFEKYGVKPMDAIKLMEELREVMK